MSASLVGSEMCIRDRVVCVRNGCAPCAGNICNSELVCAERMCDDSAALPVSYTHLTLPTICSV
eukprot:2394781-Alexandrium_andersonii.AAC.1